MLEIDACKQTSTQENAEQEENAEKEKNRKGTEENVEKGIFGMFAALEGGGECLHREVAFNPQPCTINPNHLTIYHMSQTSNQCCV